MAWKGGFGDLEGWIWRSGRVDLAIWKVDLVVSGSVIGCVVPPPPQDFSFLSIIRDLIGFLAYSGIPSASFEGVKKWCLFMRRFFDKWLVDSPMYVLKSGACSCGGF